MKKISSHTFKHTLRDIHKNTEDRKFCFVIGAGASLKSGIPTGGQLAKKWFHEIKERYSDTEIKQWIKETKVNTKNLATHYGSIYRKRFESDKTSGYEFLVQAMRSAKPTFGHVVLAQILTRATGNCVLTTNFDSLIETAIYQFTDKTPLVCGHESLSGYARPSKVHPLIIKIHRDLLLSPKSDPDELSALDEGWKEPLDNIFSSHIPIVIGYGGNDGSLMSYLEKMNRPSNFFWCGRSEKPESSRIEELLNQMDGNYVEIDGFDEIMQKLLWVFDEIKPIEEELDEITKARIEAVHNQLNEIQGESKKAYSDKSETVKELSAFEYSSLAVSEPDYKRREAIYLEALEKFPETVWLWSNFTYFLHFDKKDYSNLEEYYLKALAIGPEDVTNNGNFATFLYGVKKDYKEAERYYLKALSTDPENIANNGNYASFLQNVKRDYEEAERHFLKALSTDPENATNNGNYASFLKNVKKDYEEAEKYFLKALSIDPENATNNGNYASFLTEIKKDHEEAERWFLKALSIDPMDAINNGNYASFLCDIKKDQEEAERYYLKAISIDPENAGNNGNYANFLKNVKKDYEEAEKYFLKAVSIDPENATNNGNYANLLTEKKDYQEAEKYFLIALSTDSLNANHNGNYAYLLTKKKDYQEAEKYYLKALSIDPENETNNGNYSNFLRKIKKDYQEAEKYCLKALSIDPENAGNNGNYANFLMEIKKDYQEAEKYFLKALSIDPENATNNGNYANLLTEKKDYQEAEKYFLIALSTDSLNPNHNGNYAKLLLIMNRINEATEYLKIAFQLNNDTKNGLLIELRFYEYAHYLESLDKSRNAIEKLLKEGIKSIGWNLDLNVEIAIKNGHPNPEKLRELAIKITQLED